LAFLPSEPIIEKSRQNENTETFDFGGNFSVYDNLSGEKREIIFDFC
jgi:hypothetical protein